MFLLDTMVLSESIKARPTPAVVTWLESNRRQALFMSVASVGEITRGIRKLGGRDISRANAYRAWLDDLLARFADNVLPVQISTMKIWGRLSLEQKNSDPDLLIAASALEHDLTLVTRNIRHFEPTGVRLFNPHPA